MGMTPMEYYDAFVLANYYDCIDNPGCVRRAFNAAVSSSHLADHYWTYWKKNDPSKISAFNTIGDFVQDLSHNTGGCFRDIRSIANAYKHLYTSTNPKKSAFSSIASTGAIESIIFNDESLEVNDIEESFSRESGGTEIKSKVVYTCKDGQQKYFMNSLEIFINYWQKNYLYINM
jgi:hypothetical protein